MNIFIVDIFGQSHFFKVYPKCIWDNTAGYSILFVIFKHCKNLWEWWTTYCFLTFWVTKQSFLIQKANWNITPTKWPVKKVKRPTQGHSSTLRSQNQTSMAAFLIIQIYTTNSLFTSEVFTIKVIFKLPCILSVILQVVNDYMSTAFSKEKAACQTYIDRSIELCWLMSVQDPPVVIDFIAVHGQAIDDKILRKFTKTGSKIDFLVWPVIRLHKNGPLLQKGVVQPI